MKYFVLVGGSLGFSLAFSSALAAGNDVSVAVKNGTIGCMVGAFLLKGFHMVMMACIRGALLEKHQAAEVTADAGTDQGNGTINRTK